MEEEHEWDDYPEISPAKPDEDNRKGRFRHHKSFDDAAYQKHPGFGEKSTWFSKEKEPLWATVEKRETSTRYGKMMMANEMFKMPHSTVQETSLAYQLMQQFIAEASGDVFFCKASFAVSKNKASIRDVLERIKAPLDNSVSVMPFDNRIAVVTGTNGGEKVLIWVALTQHPDVHQINVDITASPDVAERVHDKIVADFQQERLASIKWWVSGRHGDESREFFLPTVSTTLHPEFYPDLGDPAKYMADYMASDESVLLLAGPPGTGKTTLLRHLISDYKLRAYVIYDEAVMARDAVFQQFLFENDSDVMIIEDADTILSSREKDGNKLMARFLNISDGLIKLPNKKLVFTTNITDFGNVDPALLRPGRCFGVMHTRLLNLAEAQKAAKVAGSPIPIEKREYAVAEIFNQGKRQEARQIGFGARH